MIILERQIKRALNLKWIKYVYPLREHPNRAPYFLGRSRTLKINAYIDGFNLYHSIDALKDNTLKWLNLRKLCELFLKEGDELNEVYYFSAPPTHLPTKMQRYEAYTKALQGAGVKAIFGSFKKKFAKCHVCGARYVTHEEKQTDINIAIKLLQDVFNDDFDKAFLVTADTDLVSTIKTIRQTYPHKSIILLTPPNRAKYSHELKQNATASLEIKVKHIRRALLPNEVNFNGEIVKIPAEYQRV